MKENKGVSRVTIVGICVASRGRFGEEAASSSEHKACYNDKLNEKTEKIYHLRYFNFPKHERKLVNDK